MANGGGEVSLPADYVACHVEFAYATTAYRSQGRTTDTAHAVVSPATTREVLYVSATRGRESNSLYVDTSFDPDPATSHDGMVSQRTAQDVLAAVLANSGADLSAHDSLERAQLLGGGLRRPRRRVRDLDPSRPTASLWRVAGPLRPRTRTPRGDPPEPRLRPAPRSYPRRRSATVSTWKRSLPGLVAARSLDDAEDIAAVIRDRIERWADANGSRRRTGTDLIAGLIPRAVGVTDTDMARGLQERAEALQRRARELAEACH